MNILEHHILEVYDVKTVNMDGGWSFVQVDMMVDCWGNKRRVQESFINMEAWKKVEEQGYYMA